MKTAKKSLSLRKETIQHLQPFTLREIDGRSGLTNAIADALAPKVRPLAPTEICVSCQHTDIAVKWLTVQIPVDLGYSQ